MHSVKRRLTTLGLAALIAFGLAAGPAAAIVYGEPDGGEHPYVGSMVAFIPDRGYFQLCSGTLVPGGGDHAGDDVFLTASHCLGIGEGLPEGSWVKVTFDDTIGPDSTYYAGTEYAHPNYPGPASDSFDVGVIVLEEHPGVGYGALPEGDLLGTMKDEHTLRDQVFTAVGYGTVRETRMGAFDSILDNLDRNMADQEVLSLTKAWLTLSMNEATGNGGTCYGDSGGPHLLAETNIVVSVTVTGDAPCKATDKTYRVDTEVARAFLEDFVTLP